MAAPTRKITELRWQETSGVDHPANEEEGWAIMKNADVSGLDELDQLIKHEAAMAKDAEELAEKLKGLKDSDPPKDVADACDVILKYLEEQYGYGYAKPNDGGGYPAPKSIAEMIRSMWEKVTGAYGKAPRMKKALAEEWPAFCQTVATTLHSEATGEEKATQLAKAVNDLEAAVKAAAEK